jgi:hypothetical protein
VIGRIDGAPGVHQPPRDLRLAFEDGAHQRGVAVVVAHAWVGTRVQQIVERGGLTVVGGQNHSRIAASIGGIERIPGFDERPQNVDAAHTGSREPVVVEPAKGRGLSGCVRWPLRQPYAARERQGDACRDEQNRYARYGMRPDAPRHAPQETCVAGRLHPSSLAASDCTRERSACTACARRVP